MSICKWTDDKIMVQLMSLKCQYVSEQMTKCATNGSASKWTDDKIMVQVSICKWTDDKIMVQQLMSLKWTDDNYDWSVNM